MISRELEQAIQQVVQKAFRSLHYEARLGKGDTDKTLFVQGRPNYVWARIGVPTTSVVQVRCTKVTPAYGLEVRLWHDYDNVLSVATQDDEQASKFYGGRVVGNAGPHNLSHTYFGMDPILLDGRQFLPLACQPNDPQDLSVRVRPCILYDGTGTAVAFVGGNLDLTAHVPSSANEQRIVIVGYDMSTNGLTATAGSAKTVAAVDTTNVPFSDAEAAAIDVADNVVPIMAVRLFNGQTQISIHDCFKDMRPFFTLPWLTSGAESGGSAVGVAGHSGLRLTTVSGVSKPTGNNSASGTLYLTKHSSWRIDLYDADIDDFLPHYLSTEVSLSLTGLTAGYQYDIFYDGTDLSAVSWGGSSSRATALDEKKGVKVQDGAPEKIHVGTIKIDAGGGTCTQNLKNLGVWNRYNKVGTEFVVAPADNSWFDNTTTIKAWNGDTTISVAMCKGEAGDFIHATLQGYMTNPAGNQGIFGIGLNTSSSFTSEFRSLGQVSRSDPLTIPYNTSAALGLNTIYPLHRCNSTGGNVTFYGDANIPTIFQMGLTGFTYQ